MNIKHRFKAIIFLLILLFPQNHSWATSHDAPDVHIVDELIAQAQQLQLAKNSAWYDLLHYKQSVFGSFYSQADDDEFFLAQQGKHDAEAELAATLKGFFSVKSEQHPQCRFPARLYWLNAQLHFSGDLPVVDCHKFNVWKNNIDAQSITMLFPSMYLNNPGSMFGHTFLRLNKKNNPNLLNYTLSYAAAHDSSDNMAAYVYKGLSGGYRGIFSVQPYYETVQAYGDIEQRDIWEYALNLDKNEVDQLIRHVWEVSGINFDYYFFRENCSYRLLSLLDVARPGLNMTRDHHYLYAIPVDTVRSSSRVDIIKNAEYRPARNARIQQMFKQMNTEAQQKTLDMLQTKEINFAEKQFSNIEQAKILEAADEMSQFKNAADNFSDKLLSARSRIKLEDSKSLFVFSSQRPDEGHDSARWHLAYGESNKHNYAEIGLRPAFHDLLDSDKGFVKGAAISILDTHVRWYENTQKLQLEQLGLFSMTLLSPLKPWASPLSGRLNILVNREKINNQMDAKVFNVDSALGYTFEWRDNLFYALADSQLGYSKEYHQNYMLALGTEIGALLKFENSRMQFKSRFLYSVAGEDRDKEKHQWFYQYDVEKNRGLRLGACISKDSLSIWRRDVQMSYLMYF